MLSIASISWYLALLFAVWTLVMSIITTHPDLRAKWDLLTMSFAVGSLLFAIIGVIAKRFFHSRPYYRRGWPLRLYTALAVLLTAIFVIGFLG